MPAQKIDIEMLTGDDMPELHCPVCGALIQTPEDAVEFPVCPHVVFSYIYENDDFEYLADDLVDYVEGLTEEDREKHGNRMEAVRAIMVSDTCFVITLTTSSFTCGPCSFSVAYGIEFDPVIDEEEPVQPAE
jgi:hypothetical protein